MKEPFILKKQSLTTIILVKILSKDYTVVKRLYCYQKIILLDLDMNLQNEILNPAKLYKIK